MATIQVYKDNAGEYRWRKLAANGELIADSGEGYDRKAAALEAAHAEADIGDEVVLEEESV